MQRFSVALLLGAASVSAGPASGPIIDSIRKTNFVTAPKHKWGKQQPFWAETKYGTSRPDAQGNQADAKLYWITEMFANTNLKQQQLDQNVALAFEDYVFQSWFQFGALTKEELDPKTNKMVLAKPTKAQNVVCSVKYAHPGPTPKKAGEENERRLAGGMNMPMGGMKKHDCTETGNMHCTMNDWATEKRDLYFKRAQWCEEDGGAKEAPFIKASAFKGGMAVTAPVGKDTKTDGCTPWELSRLSADTNDGLHLHYAKNKNSGKHYARCAMARFFADEDESIKGTYDLKMNTSYWVRAGLNVYDETEKLQHRSVQDWQKIYVQEEAGATMGAVVSLGLAAGAAVLLSI